jgi:hypothetical protein
MKTRNVIQIFFGSTIVYVAMAACSGGGNPPTGSSAQGGSGGHSSNSSSNSGGNVGGDDGGIWDALTDPVPEADAEPMSGSRLKRKFRLGDDGSKEYEQVVVQVSGGTTTSVRGVWYDSERQDDCVFMTAGDGKQRCLPLGYQGALQYSDSQCTKAAAPVPAAPAGCPMSIPKYVVTIDASAVCPQPLLELSNHVYTVGSFLGQITLYYKTSNGSCAAGGGPPPNQLIYELTQEVDVTSFVQASVGVDP